MADALTLIQCITATYASTTQAGMVASKFSRTQFNRLLDGLLAFAKPPFVLDCRMDKKQVYARRSTVLGCCPMKLSVSSDGLVDLAELRRLLDLGAATVGRAETAAFKKLLELDGKSFTCFLIELGRNAARMTSSACYQRLCGQILWQIQNMIEDRFLTRTPSRGVSGKIRKVQRYASDVSAGQCADTPAYLPTNPVHTKRELSRYMGAAAHELKNVQFISTAGPDQTKIGTDYPVTNTAVMNCSSEMVMWAPPQAFPLLWFGHRISFFLPAPPRGGGGNGRARGGCGVVVGRGGRE